MIALKVRENGDLGSIGKQRRVEFVGFDDHPAPLAESTVVVIERWAGGTDEKAGVVARGSEHRGRHRAGGGLAVGPGDGDAARLVEELGDDRGARSHRHSTGPGLDELHVVRRYGRGMHHQVDAGNIADVMAALDLGAARREPIRCGGGAQVTPAQVQSEIEQRRRDAGHAGTGDAHDMHAAYSGRQQAGRRGAHAGAACQVGSASSIASRATASAASGRPRAAAARRS